MYFVHIHTTLLTCLLAAHPGICSRGDNCWGETSNYKHKHLCSLSPLNHFTPGKLDDTLGYFGPLISVLLC